MADQNPVKHQFPARPHEARQWMDGRARVECFAACDPSRVMHEGWIVGMTEAPTVRVLKDDGQVVTWVLGITRRQEQQPARTPRVWTDADRENEPADCVRVIPQAKKQKGKRDEPHG